VKIPEALPPHPREATKTVEEYHKIRQLENLAHEEVVLMREIDTMVARVRAIRMEGSRLRQELSPTTLKGVRKEKIGPNKAWDYEMRIEKQEGDEGADEVVLARLRKELGKK
jgi:hypothetical protein